MSNIMNPNSKSEDEIVEELMLHPSISTTQIQRKYQLNYDGAIRIVRKWEDRQPKEPTMEERIERFRKNPTFRKSPPKKRKTPFLINGKMLHSWTEAQTELNKIQGGI